METFSLEPRESVWLNGGTECLSTVRGPELGRRKGQAQLRTTAVCRGLTVAQGDFLVARWNFNARQYKNAQSIPNALVNILVEFIKF